MSPRCPSAIPSLSSGATPRTQPSHDWAVQLDSVTIIGLWTNVPSGGTLEPEQLAFLVAQLKAAPPAKPLLLCLHHPPYSVDAMHGGCAKIGSDIDQAVASAGSPWPTAVLSGHVHDCQFLTRRVDGPVFGPSEASSVLYVVSGNGGYHNRHAIASDYSPGMQVSDEVTVDYADAEHYGFLTLTLDDGVIEGTYTGVMPGVDPSGMDAAVSPGLYSFSI